MRARRIDRFALAEAMDRQGVSATQFRPLSADTIRRILAGTVMCPHPATHRTICDTLGVDSLWLPEPDELDDGPPVVGYIRHIVIATVPTPSPLVAEIGFPTICQHFATTEEESALISDTYVITRTITLGPTTRGNLTFQINAWPDSRIVSDRIEPVR